MNNVKGLKGMILCALFAALMAVCSWITIPYVVPFTMQTFAVFVALDLLGWRGTLITVLVYMALGAVGLPVFSGFSGGVSHLIGPTGGICQIPRRSMLPFAPLYRFHRIFSIVFFLKIVENAGSRPFSPPAGPPRPAGAAAMCPAAGPDRATAGPSTAA